MTTTAPTAGELQLAGRRRQLPELHAAVRHAPTPQDGPPVETDQRLAITTDPDDNAHLRPRGDSRG